MSLVCTCLVVDDDSGVRHFVRSILHRQGFQVLEALDGIQALRLAEKLGDALDLIVSDIQMPSGDGLRFAGSIHRRYPRIPILLISGSSEGEQSMFEFLPKPFTPAQLLAAIERAASRSRTQSDGNLPRSGNSSAEPSKSLTRMP